MTFRIKGLRHAALAILAASCPQVSNATVVEFQTVAGNFEVNLYDNATPATVANFLNYVNNGLYSNSVMHRSVPGFIVQGGGFTFDLALPLGNVQTFATVVNEPEFANVRGTIAMAKVGGNPNSATSQWFFNLANNTANLDNQNGGFTVFGEVVGNGMDVVDAIAALPRFNLGGAAAEIPLRNYSQADFNNSVPIDDTHVVIVDAVIISDSTVDSAAGLNPTPSTASQGGGSGGAGGGGGGGGGGGSFGIFALAALLIAGRRRLR